MVFGSSVFLESSSSGYLRRTKNFTASTPVGLSSTICSPTPTPTTFWSGATLVPVVSARRPCARGTLSNLADHSFLALWRSATLRVNRVKFEVFISLVEVFMSFVGLDEGLGI